MSDVLAGDIAKAKGGEPVVDYNPWRVYGYSDRRTSIASILDQLKDTGGSLQAANSGASGRVRLRGGAN